MTRIDDELARDLDALVAEGVVESRSDAVRRGLRALVERHRRRRIGEAIVTGYRERPQTDDEIAWARDAAVRMIEDEPW